MKNLQINTLKTHWPMVATTNKNVYLCPEIIEEMNNEALLNENEELAERQFRSLRGCWTDDPEDAALMEAAILEARASDIPCEINLD